MEWAMTITVASGRLAAIEPSVTTWTTIYKPGATVQATIDVHVCNRKNATRTIRIAQVQNASINPTPGDGEMRVYDTSLAAAGDADDRDKASLRGLLLNGANNDQAVVYVSGDDVDFIAEGVTETAS